MPCRGYLPADRGGASAPSPKGGRTPSRVFLFAVGGALGVAALLVSLGALTAAHEDSGGSGAGIPAFPLDSTTGPYQMMPDRIFASDEFQDAKAADPTPANNAVDPAATAPSPAEAIASSAVQAPEAVASSRFAPPSPVPVAPAAPPETAAVRLARQVSERFGVRIVLDGQDWGPDEASQQTNIAAISSVMERLPQSVVSAVVSHANGPLTFVSNSQGRTLDGWQPYGDFPMGYYTNSDQGPNGSRPANEVVLIPGFSDISIGHEVLHAYHFRNVGPDQYALALLGDEMRSFMAATGWRQIGSDEQVQETINQPWDAVNQLFVYEGRPLTYTSAADTTVTLTPPNPLEAFAVAGSIYYTRPSGVPLPDWPEYWAWFQQNLG
ncbi:MAG: hypothetical protein HYY03_00125 [Chloroflexi bacterium]|nr:hypothetical protein [Chloroflexota bacterium]